LYLNYFRARCTIITTYITKYIKEVSPFILKKVISIITKVWYCTSSCIKEGSNVPFDNIFDIRNTAIPLYAVKYPNIIKEFSAATRTSVVVSLKLDPTMAYQLTH
jgi:hypothetical protein